MNTTQCPNCQSYYTKSESKAYKKTVLSLAITSILLGILMKFIGAELTAVLFISIGCIVGFVFGYRLFIEKKTYNKCASCNYKWYTE